MMAAVVQIVGNASAAPTTRSTSSGEVCTFSLCSQERRRLADGSYEDGDVTWFRVTAWRGLGKNVAASIRKGDRVMVFGTLVERKWTDPDGKEHRSLDVTAEDVGLSMTWRSATSGRTVDGLAALLDGPAS